MRTTQFVLWIKTIFAFAGFTHFECHDWLIWMKNLNWFLVHAPSTIYSRKNWRGQTKKLCSNFTDVDRDILKCAIIFVCVHLMDYMGVLYFIWSSCTFKTCQHFSRSCVLLLPPFSNAFFLFIPNVKMCKLIIWYKKKKKMQISYLMRIQYQLPAPQIRTPFMRKVCSTINTFTNCIPATKVIAFG